MTDIGWLTKRPIAHRGLHDGNHEIWENTLAAFRRAIEAGFAIECDVHQTKDDQVIVFHDDDMLRLAGRGGLISDLPLAEATRLRIGGTEECAPSLRQLLDLVNGQVPLIIELKGIEGTDGALVKAVARELANYQGEAAIMSFDHHLIRRFATEAPGIPAGLTAEGRRMSDMEQHFSMLARNIDFVSYNVEHLPNPFVTFVRERLNMPVISWTVTDWELKKQSDLYADQITFEGFDPRVPAA